MFSPQFFPAVPQWFHVVEKKKKGRFGQPETIPQMHHQNFRLVQRRQTKAFPKTHKLVNTCLGIGIIKILFLRAEKAILKNIQR